MTREVQLSQGYVALVDDEDYDDVMAAGPWSADVNSASVYAKRNVRCEGRPNSSSQRLHSFLTGWRFVDHISGDGLDNRRANLRPATKAQNNANARLSRANKSGFKGVRARRNLWRAEIRHDGRSHHLGTFTTAEDAARAYDAAAIETWGDFARTNFPRKESA